VEEKKIENEPKEEEESNELESLRANDQLNNEEEDIE
jgi:hypothetical protein